MYISKFFSCRTYSFTSDRFKDCCPDFFSFPCLSRRRPFNMTRMVEPSWKSTAIGKFSRPKIFNMTRVMMTPTEKMTRSEEHTSELQSRFDLVCRLLLEKKKDKR